ncbi:UNVERIFIED_CONTAM: hypothetical protein HDU68_007803 [Siphonaria sp. JEL0065]|nr:hypothetical protein HDU68_007803 [Siphonaria sp. JEL0065]
METKESNSNPELANNGAEAAHALNAQTDESTSAGVSVKVLRRSSVPVLRTTGAVKFFNAQKGYGFIIPHEGELEVFVHHTAILRPDGGFRSLLEGEEVEFDLIHGPKGLQAANVTGPNGATVIGDPQALQGSSQQQHLFNNGLHHHPHSMYPPLPPMMYPSAAQFNPTTASDASVSPSDAGCSIDKAVPPQFHGGNNNGDGINYGYPLGDGQWSNYIQTPYGFAYMGAGGPQTTAPPGFTYPPPGLKNGHKKSAGTQRSTEPTSSPPTSEVTTPPKSNDRRPSSSLSAVNSNSTLQMSSNGSLYGGAEMANSPYALASPYLDRRGSQAIYPYPNYYQQYYYPVFPVAEGPNDVLSPQQQPELLHQQQQYPQAGPNGGYFYYPAPPQPIKTHKKGRFNPSSQQQQHQQQPYQQQQPHQQKQSSEFH